MVVGRRAHPGRRALEDRELADFGRDLGDELHRARAGADDRDPLAAEVDVVVPASGVERRSLERVAAGDVGELRPVELTDGADDGVRVHRLGARRASHFHRPGLGRVVPGGRLDLGVEVDVLAELERVGAVAEVVEQHVLGREVERPVVPLRERVAVVVVRVVDAAAGIGVLPPRAADLAVLLDDHERDAGLLQPVRGEQARTCPRR